MIILTIDEIIAIHTKLIEKTGGSDGLRDRGLLESAVYSVYNSFDNVEVYPTIEEKAARLAYALVGNHSFVDGNKRIGILAMLMVLKVNSIDILYTQQELITLGLSVADGSYHYEEIREWIKKHKLS